MGKIRIENLYLEVTRDCTLECMHCFRGNREHSYMDASIIQKLLKNVNHINYLLLTGGEPFLAIEQLEKVMEMIKTNGIKVDAISIITNGTVLSPRVIKTLKFFDSNFRLYLTVSKDKFHTLELENKGLLDTRNKNVEELKKLFGICEYSPNRLPNLIQKVGRAVNLTKEDLREINYSGDVQTKYILGDEFDIKNARDKYMVPTFDGKCIKGCLSIAIDGSIVPTYCSFIEEDENSYVKYNRFKSYPEMVSLIEQDDNGNVKVKKKI